MSYTDLVRDLTQKRGQNLRHGIFFHFCLGLRQTSFHWIVSDRVISRIGRKWKCSDSRDSNSVKLVTTFKTPIFDVHQVVCALKTLIITLSLILSQVKTHCLYSVHYIHTRYSWNFRVLTHLNSHVVIKFPMASTAPPHLWYSLLHCLQHQLTVDQA